MKFKVKLVISSALVALAIGAALPAVAADSADNAIKYRQTVMKAMAGHMGAIAAIVTGKISAKDDLKAHATAMEAMASVVPHLFPEGSDFGETEALPAIWQKPDDFKKAVAAYVTAADMMNKAAMGGDMAATGAALKALGGSCGGCHKSFREKKK